MDTERFFDDVARSLAESMPRRRAVRVIGVSLAALAVPGVRPTRGHARTGVQTAGCVESHEQRICSNTLSLGTYCCGPPRWRWDCGGYGNDKCRDNCPPRNAGTGVAQFPCTAKKPDDKGDFHGRCCTRPESIGCSPDGECLPNCKLPQYGGPYAKLCGKVCCPTYTVCVDGECQPCEKYGGHVCQPPKGAATCCTKGTTCCFNAKTTACCGPEQTCKAQNVKQATCVCKPGTGTKCGTDCCNKNKGELCCNGLGTSTCCKPGERCCYGECCSGSAICCDDGCCDPKQGEFCLVKYKAGYQSAGCKKGCTPSNRCGPYCCGTGTRCVNGKCVK